MKKSKVCTKCGKRKSIDKFHKRAGRGNTLHSWCKKCMYAYYKEWSRTKSGIANIQHYSCDYYLKYAYGMNLKQYNELLKKQNDVCAICGEAESHGRPTTRTKIQRLAVDHDDKTGQIRGLLCSQCNRHLLGSLKDKDGIAVLKNAIKYLQKAVKQYQRF